MINPKADKVDVHHWVKIWYLHTNIQEEWALWNSTREETFKYTVLPESRFWDDFKTKDPDTYTRTEVKSWVTWQEAQIEEASAL